MEDYYLKVNNIQNAMNYIEVLGKQLEGKDEAINISFVQTESLDLYESYPLIDFGKRYNINVIPSILFTTMEDIDVIVINPNESGNGNPTPVVDLLLDINVKKSYRIINMLYSLSDKFSFNITPEQLLNKIGKTEYTDLYLSKDSDIIDLIVANKYCGSFMDASQNYFNRVMLPRLLLNLSDMIQILQGEQIWISQPYKFIGKYNDYLENITGFITNDVSNSVIINILDKYNLKAKRGSGLIID